jgi:hypothetical protein
MESKISRRQFVASVAGAAAGLSLGFLPGISSGSGEKISDGELEKLVRIKAEKSVRMPPYALRHLKALNPFREKNITLVYDMLNDDSDSRLATGSINFDSRTRMLDVGIDSFSFFIGAGLFLKSIFSEKSRSIYELKDLRTTTEFGSDFTWVRYRENVPVNENKEEKPNENGNKEAKLHEYELKGKKVFLESKEFASSKSLIQNPLSALFEIFNGDRPNNFELVANENYLSNVRIDYAPYNGVGDFSTLYVDFEKPIIKRFKKVYALLFDNIPLAGYIKMLEDSDIKYIRGRLNMIKINGNTEFTNI